MGTLVLVVVVEVPLEAVEDVEVLEDVVEEVLVAAPNAPGEAAKIVQKTPRATVNNHKRPRENRRSALLLFWRNLHATISLPAGSRRSSKPCPPQIMPSFSALCTQGITSSSISSSVVVASKPSTRLAFSTDGIRLATSCSKGGSTT